MSKMTDSNEHIKTLRQMLLRRYPGWYKRGHDGMFQQVSMWIRRGTDALDALEEALKPAEDAEEGEFTSCADVLDDWFNSCNVQGTAEMETVEVEELIDEMRRIEKHQQARIAELEAPVTDAEINKCKGYLDLLPYVSRPENNQYICNLIDRLARGQQR